MNYIKQLDSVRAIAVILVIIWHWVPRNGFLENIQGGSLGVNIFFVLSGFLITSILLSNRKQAENSDHPKQKVLKNFYVRRVLRIFPVYYFCVLLTLLLNHPFSLGVTSQELLANLSYTSNFLIYFNKVWPLASLHFWSLAVEEQFYLVWPLLMLFLPRKSLLPVIIGFIAIGLVSQLLTTDHEFGHLPTNTCLDCFGAGGFVAFVAVYHGQLLHKCYRLLSIACIACFVVLLLDWQFHFYVPCMRFLHSIISAWLINYILLYRHKKNLLFSVLNGKLLIHIGKVSYGIYLYHMLYVYAANQVWYDYVFDYYLPFINPAYEPWIFLFFNFWILYFIAWLSWRLIEKPFLSLKTKFSYLTSEKHREIVLSEVA